MFCPTGPQAPSRWTRRSQSEQEEDARWNIGLLATPASLVSKLAFGNTSWHGHPQLGGASVEEARRHVDLALDAGISLFDTANRYGFGRCEEMLGEALGSRRDSVLIATKVHNRMSENVNDGGLSRKHVLAACEASLRRLKTDYIDLYQMHGWDGITPLDETLDARDVKTNRQIDT